METIEIINTHTQRRIKPTTIRSLIKLIIKKETKKKPGFFSIVFLTNARMKQLNRDFLNHDYPTDVISFDLSSNDRIDGEIFVSLDQAYKQAREFNVAYSNEVLRLVAHGVLHILGYDDRTISQRQVMLELGDRYIGKLK
ncbi:rRNA maturation RNase YbeY [bacterium]|nr:rRNA maturation RNase YbeY [bacterium]